MNDQADQSKQQSKNNNYFVPHDSILNEYNLPRFTRLTSISITLALLISIAGVFIIPTGIMWIIIDFKHNIYHVYQHNEELLSFILCILSIIVTVNAFKPKYKAINVQHVSFLAKIWLYWFIFVVILMFYAIFT